MPFELPLPARLRANGWKVKIREKKRVEPPHVTILHKVDEWRLGLRDRLLLAPPGGRIKDIEPEVRRIIDENWERLIDAWDEKYPENPVDSTDDEDEEDSDENGD